MISNAIPSATTRRMPVSSHNGVRRFSFGVSGPLGSATPASESSPSGLSTDGPVGLSSGTQANVRDGPGQGSEDRYVRLMSELLRGIPGLYWVAFVFLGLALWVDDVFGIVIATACMVIGTLQLLRAPRGPGGPGGSGEPDAAHDADQSGDQG